MTNLFDAKYTPMCVIPDAFLGHVNLFLIRDPVSILVQILQKTLFIFGYFIHLQALVS